MEKMAYTVKEFCAAFCIDPHRFYDEVKKGRLRIYKVGRKTLISVDAARAWQKLLESQPVAVVPTVGVRKRMSAKEAAFRAAQMPLPEVESMGEALPPMERNEAIKPAPALVADMPVKRGPGRPRKVVPLDMNVVRDLRDNKASRAWPFEEKKTRLVPGS